MVVLIVPAGLSSSVLNNETVLNLNVMVQHFNQERFLIAIPPKVLPPQRHWTLSSIDPITCDDQLLLFMCKTFCCHTEL